MKWISKREKRCSQTEDFRGKIHLLEEEKGQLVKKRASEKNLSRKNKMLSILYIILSENYSNSKGPFIKELISVLSPLLSDWRTSVMFLLITLSLVV